MDNEEMNLAELLKQTAEIAEKLNALEIRTIKNNPWTGESVKNILRNEKYCGDVLMQKTFRQDFINRKAIKNTGQLPMYLIENHHEGIVSREKYDAVQAEMARRNAAKSPSAVSAGPCIAAAHGHETVKNESCGAV